MLYSFTHMATVGAKGLMFSFSNIHPSLLKMNEYYRTRREMLVIESVDIWARCSIINFPEVNLCQVARHNNWQTVRATNYYKSHCSDFASVLANISDKVGLSMSFNSNVTFQNALSE